MWFNFLTPAKCDRRRLKRKRKESQTEAPQCWPLGLTLRWPGEAPHGFPDELPRAEKTWPYFPAGISGGGALTVFPTWGGHNKENMAVWNIYHKRKLNIRASMHLP